MNKCLNCCFMSPALILKHTSDDSLRSPGHISKYILSNVTKRDERKWSHQLYHRLYQHRAHNVHIRDLRTRTSAQNKVEIFCSILLRIISSIIEFFQVKYFSLWKFATRFEIFPFGRHGMFPWQSTTRSISVRFWFSFSVIN